MLGLFPGLAIPADHLLNGLVNGSESAAAHVVGHHLTSPDLHGVALVASVLIPVLVPGLVVTAMVLVAQASFEIRKAAAAIALLGSLASFLVLPASSAGVLLVAAVIFAVLSAVATGLVLVIPLVAGATMLAVRFVDQIVHDRYPAVAIGARRLAGSFGGGAHLWRAMLVLVALAPVVVAGSRLLRRHGRLLSRAAHLA